MEINIKLDTFEKIKEYIQTSIFYPGDVIVKSGYYTVDGKSLMGVMSLNLSNPITLVLVNGTSEDMKKFEKYRV